MVSFTLFYPQVKGLRSLMLGSWVAQNHICTWWRRETSLSLLGIKSLLSGHRTHIGFEVPPAVHMKSNVTPGMSYNLTLWPSPRVNYTDQAPASLSAKVVSTFADRGCHVVSVTDPLRPYSRISTPEPLLFLPSSSTIVLARLSGPCSRPTASQKIWCLLKINVFEECWIHLQGWKISQSRNYQEADRSNMLDPSLA
jgi:hypothetical protein